MIELLWLFLGGATAGLVGALLGVGGGVLVVPLLHLGFDLPLPVAVGTSLVTITGTSLAGSAGYLKRDLVRLDLAIGLGLGSLAGAVAASLLAVFVPEDVLAPLFAAVMVYAAVHLFWKSHRAGDEEPPEPTPGRTRAAYLLSPGAGLASGLLGIGGGIVQVPILRLLVGLDIRRAVATSTLMVGFNTSIASIAYLSRDDVALSAVPLLLAGILTGATVAPRLGERIPRRALEAAFSLLLLYAAVRMVL